MNNDIFEFRKKIEFIGPNGVRIRKKSFNMLTYSPPPPPGQPQQDPMADARS